MIYFQLFLSFFQIGLQLDDLGRRRAPGALELLDLVGNLLLTLIIIGLRLVQSVQFTLQCTDFLFQPLNFSAVILSRRRTG